MALIRCPGCGENISEYERSCPFCGKLIKLDNGRKVIHNNIFFKEEYSKINICLLYTSPSPRDTR